MRQIFTINMYLTNLSFIVKICKERFFCFQVQQFRLSLAVKNEKLTLN